MPCRPSTSQRRTRLPLSASDIASAAATVVLPVPPLPVTTWSCVERATRRAYFAQPDAQGDRYSRAMTKWEYLTAPVLVHATKQILDNFGQDGWELVQIVPGMNPENLVAYFKRPIA